MRKAVLILLVGFAVSAHTEELPVLLFLGQSIAINSGTDAGRLPVKWLTTRTNLLFFNGRTHAVSTAETHWVWYKPPTGPGYATDSVYPNPSGTFGPEISAAKLIGERSYSNSTVAVFKYAVGATDLAHQWRASRPAGDIYIDMRARLAEALTSLRRETGCTGRIAGVFWTQGESDALNGTNSAAGYAENLKDFIVTLRHDLHAGNVPFIYARISPQWPNAELVRSSQERVSKELSAVAMVNADDLATPTRHYDNEGTLRLGGRFAAAFEQVVTVQLSESAEPPTPR